MQFRALFLFLLSVPSIAQAQSGQFCLQTFNVYATAYASGVSQRLSNLATALTREPCGAIQFQEFWRESDYRAFLTEFGRSQMQLVRADEIRRDSKIIGLSSAFRGEVKKSYSEIFTINNEDGMLDWFRNLTGVQKGITAIEAKIENGPQALFLNTHTHPTSEAIRTAQMLQLVDFALLRAEKAAELPLLMTGDLNAVPGSMEMALLQNVLLLKDAYLENHGSYGKVCTYCANNPLSWLSEDRVFDFVLYRSAPGLELKPASTEINLRGSAESPLSDHFGVRSILGFTERAPTLLAADSGVVRARVTLAIQTLERARALLVLAHDSVFDPALDDVDHLIKTLKRASLPPAVDLIYRTP